MNTAAEDFAEEVGAEIDVQPVIEAGFSARIYGYDVYFKLDASELKNFVAWVDEEGGKPVLKGGTTVAGTEDELGEETFDCPMIRFSREDSGKFMIQFFKVLGDGSLSQYPEVKHTAEREEAWGEILEPVLTEEQSEQLKELPAKIEGEWSVTYKLGRPTGNMLADGVTPSHYKDLIRFEVRSE